MCRPDSRRCARDGALRCSAMRVLLVTPPMIQLNTPYPATAYLTGFLRLHAAELGLTVTQADASIELFCGCSRRRSSSAWPTSCAGARAPPRSAAVPPSIAHFLAHAERYVETVEPAIRFLQRRDPSLALRIVGRALPARRPALRALAAPSRSTTRSTSSSRRRSARSARRSRRATSPASTSTISPTSGATASTRASSSRDMASGSPRARPHSIRCTRRSTGEPTLVDETLDELTRELVARAAARRRRHHRAVPRQRVRRVSHGARDPRGGARHDARARRRLGQHRAALAARAARVRLLRLRDARRRRAAAAESAVAAARARARRWCAPTCARAARSCSRPTPRSTTSRTRDTGIPTYDGLPLDHMCP